MPSVPERLLMELTNRLPVVPPPNLNGRDHPRAHPPVPTVDDHAHCGLWLTESVHIEGPPRAACATGTPARDDQRGRRCIVPRRIVLEV
jgi:hypothetical protein